MSNATPLIAESAAKVYVFKQRDRVLDHRSWFDPLGSKVCLTILRTLNFNFCLIVIQKLPFHFSYNYTSKEINHYNSWRSVRRFQFRYIEKIFIIVREHLFCFKNASITHGCIDASTICPKWNFQITYKPAIIKSWKLLKGMNATFNNSFQGPWSGIWKCPLISKLLTTQRFHLHSAFSNLWTSGIIFILQEAHRTTKNLWSVDVKAQNLSIFQNSVPHSAESKCPKNCLILRCNMSMLTNYLFKCLLANHKREFSYTT